MVLVGDLIIVADVGVFRDMSGSLISRSNIIFIPIHGIVDIGAIIGIRIVGTDDGVLSLIDSTIGITGLRVHPHRIGRFRSRIGVRRRKSDLIVCQGQEVFVSQIRILRGLAVLVMVMRR